jgi:hypothetical protein
MRGLDADQVDVMRRLGRMGLLVLADKLDADAVAMMAGDAAGSESS